MKIFASKRRDFNGSVSGASKPAVVLNLAAEKLPPFKGFTYSVREGLQLAKRSFTDIPGLKRQDL